MLAQYLFYLERAAEARAIAGAATLDNVRDRWLRSETSWTEMAARSKRNEKMRAKLIAEKATERAALKTAIAEKATERAVLITAWKSVDDA